MAAKKHRNQKGLSERSSLDENRRPTEPSVEVDHQQLRLMSDGIDGPVYVIDPNTYELLYVNEAFRKQWGDGVRETCYRALHGLDSPCPSCNNGRGSHADTNGTCTAEFRSRRTGRWFHCTGKAVRWPDGRLVRYEMAFDITDHKQVEELLQYRTHELDARIKELNCLYGLSKLVENPEIDLDGLFQGLVDILPRSWQHPEIACARLVFDKREYRTGNFRTSKWQQAAPIIVHGRSVGAIEVYYAEERPGIDAEPFRKEEQNLLDVTARRLGRIAERTLEKREVLEISTREQRRIGQELHDGLGQELTGLGYLAATLYGELQDRGAAEVEIADRLTSGIQNAMEQVRTIAQGLVPAEIHVHGLVSALERLAADTQQRSGIDCRCLCCHGASVDNTATAAQLFRIAQEAVNNAVKHGEAKSIVIELKSGDGRIAIEVRDDGVGIRCDVTQTAGMGLRIMQHRADVIGATLRIRSAETGGTLVRCTLPRDT